MTIQIISPNGNDYAKNVEFIHFEYQKTNGKSFILFLSGKNLIVNDYGFSKGTAIEIDPKKDVFYISCK